MFEWNVYSIKWEQFPLQMVHCPFQYMLNNIFYIDCCVRCKVLIVLLRYWAAAVSPCLEMNSNYHHQSKIDDSVATTKHFTGLIGASLAKCIWSPTSLKYLPVTLYSLCNLYCSSSQMGFMNLCYSNKNVSFQLYVAWFLQPWMLQRMSRGHAGRRDVCSGTQRGWWWNRTALQKRDTLQHQAGFEYCIRKQELSPHTPKALWYSCTVLIPHSTVQLCSLGWPNIQLLELDHILLLYFTWLWWGWLNWRTLVFLKVPTC